MPSPKNLTKKECEKKGFIYRKGYSYERKTKDGLRTIKVKPNCIDPNASKKKLPVKKSPVKKSPVKKPTGKKSPVKKPTGKKSPVKKASESPLSSYQKKKKAECEKQGKRYVRPYEYEKDGKVIKVRAKCYDVEQISSQVKSPLEKIIEEAQKPEAQKPEAQKPDSPSSKSENILPNEVIDESEDLIISKYDEDDRILTKDNMDEFEFKGSAEKRILSRIMFQLADFVFVFLNKNTDDQDYKGKVEDLISYIYDKLNIWNDYLKTNKLSLEDISDYQLLYVYLSTFNIKYNIDKKRILSVDDADFTLILIPDVLKYFFKE